MSVRHCGDVDLLELEGRIDEVRHAVALAGMAVQGIVLNQTFDKDGVRGLEELLFKQQEVLGEIGRALAKSRQIVPLKTVTG